MKTVDFLELPEEVHEEIQWMLFGRPVYTRRGNNGRMEMRQIFGVLPEDPRYAILEEEIAEEGWQRIAFPEGAAE